MVVKDRASLPNEAKVRPMLDLDSTLGDLGAEDHQLMNTATHYPAISYSVGVSIFPTT
jgi:hypothetical protein